jgi:hypothetical protein
MVHTGCPYIGRNVSSGSQCLALGDGLNFCNTASDEYQNCLWYMCAEEAKGPESLATLSDGREF